MRPIERLLKGSLTFGGSGSFTQPPFWRYDDLYTGTSWLGDKETIDSSFEGYVDGAYKANGVIFACILARMLVFSEARFQYQRFEKGRPGDLFGDNSLSLLENPWPNGTTGELLSRMEQDASLAGNFYATTVGQGADRRIRRLRPDWVTIITGSPSDDPYDVNAQVIAYVYQPQGGTRRDAMTLLPEQVVHFSPIPDPGAQWRGMSWLTPVLSEIQSDSAGTKLKKKFFEHGTVAGIVVTYDPNIVKTREQFTAAVEAYKQAHAGVDNAWKTIHLGSGSDAKALGVDLKQLDLKAVQGAGETRIAAAAGVGAIIGRFSEGMQGSSLNQGNYNSAKRQFADMTIRPLWRTAAGALAKFATVPANCRLWYDARDVAFLQEDQKDAAQIEQIKASTIRQLVDGGFEPESVVAAVNAQNMSLLVHTGKLSVQLQEPGADVSSNGTNGREPEPVA